MTIAPSRSRIQDLETDINRLADRLLPAVVGIQNGNGDGGSGVLWRPDLVITNHHVVHGDACRVSFADGRTANATLVARQPENDLAALRLDQAEGTPIWSVTDESAETPRVGQLVVAIGHPMGVGWAVTTGILSRLPAPADRQRLLRASVTLMPGNSGGPLVDASGRLIGINTMLSGPAEAISVPVDVVEAFVSTSVR